MDDLYSIETPEHITFDYDIAGIGSRFIAALIDTIIIMLIIAAFSMLFALLPNDSFDTLALSDTFILWLAAGGLAFLFLFYYILFEMLWNGQTPGKRAINVRVVIQGGLPITFLASVLRNLLRLVDFLPSFYGIGVVSMFVDRQSRRLGDFAANTLVVRERPAVTLETLAKSSIPHTIAQQPLTLPNLDRISREDYDVVQEFMRRRNELTTTARARLAHQLSTTLQGKLDMTVAPEHAESFLQHIATEYQLSRRQLQNP